MAGLAEPLHLPVLATEVLQMLGTGDGREALDCTLGLGGHAEALLSAGWRVAGIDRDPAARTLATARLAPFGPRFQMLPGTFAEVAEDLARRTPARFHATLVDCGVSSLQLDDPQRGFSLRSPVAADMRMGEGCDGDALSLIDRLPVEELADLIRSLGEEPQAGRAARALKEARVAGISEAAGLAQAVARRLGGDRQRHPATRTFQALRMAVNDELGQLARLLECLPSLLAPGGTALAITFHSLEDRLVKNVWRRQTAAARWAESCRRPLFPSEEEQRRNPRSASAKLRWARTPKESVCA